MSTLVVVPANPLRTIASALAAVAMLLAPRPSAAAPGDLDPTFGNGGFVQTNVSLGGHALANGAALQADGKIVVVGGAWTNAGVFKVVRYNTDGSVDTGFADSGIATAEFASSGNEAKAVAIDALGRIVVVGTSGDLEDFALARFLPDGSPDDAFGVNGKVTTAVGTSTDEATSVVIQADGKIVVAGRYHNGVNAYHFAVVRYLDDGTLDSGFSGDGKVMFQFGVSTEDVNSVAIDPSTGKIVVVGSIFNGSTGVSDFGVARILTNGNLDTNFSGDGKTTTPFASNRDTEAWGVKVQSDGKVVVAGGWIEESTEFPYPPAASAFAVARYNTNGSLDSGFGTGGLVTTDVIADDTVERGYGVAIQDDGKLVVAGVSSRDSSASGNITAIRYLASGALDSSFDGDGIAVTDLGPTYLDIATAVMVQDDGNIVVAGWSMSDIVTSDVALARYTPGGALDPAFDEDGIVTTTIGPSFDYAGGVAVQHDNKVLLAGRTTIGSRDPNDVFGLLRYDTDGELDADFGDGGIVRTDFSSSASATEPARAVLVQPDHKIVVAGSAGSNLAIARYDRMGALDPGFSGDGKATITNAGAFALALQPDGKILVVGRSSSFTFLVARYNADGTLDTSFGTTGIVTTYAPSAARGVALQSDGKIVLAGGSDGSCTVARFHADGTLDASFGTGGKTTTTFGTSTSAAGCTSVAMSGSSIMVAGTSYNGTNLDFAVLRYDETGMLDPTFDTDGIVTTDMNPAASGTTTGDQLALVRVDADGKIVAVGTSRIGSFHSFAVVRYDPDGSLDASFDSDGVVVVDLGAGDDALVSGAMQPNGQKLVVAGTTSTLRDLDVAAGRLLLTPCGDGTLQAEETCDDGNYVNGDGCDETCTPTGCGNGVITEDEDCDDENAVDTDECLSSCAWNVCGDGILDPTEEVCDDGGLVNEDGCDDACVPESDCSLAPLDEASCVIAAKIQLQIRPGAEPGKNQLKWKWSAGEALEQADLGSPDVDTRYTLCVYDSRSGDPKLATWAYVAPGSLWTNKDPRGWSYKDTLAASDGIQSVSIKTGDAARTSAQVKARGLTLRMPVPYSAELYFAQQPSVVVQLRGSNGLCLSSEFTTAKRNDDGGFKSSEP